ncbi:ATP-binding cassette domain-containing protein, partial [Streptomyces sp. NRRL S-481]|uniref:ATP-binding cassette domain-containing protein n=1 Tax=Streptomyces sp. NRRL S-481 TaxID=1463911 RepID=UPI0004C6EE6B
GGQQQRVAIGSVLTPHPSVLVLDEPTSALDPAAAEEVLAVLQRLVHDLGTTVLMAEHRLERVIQYADQVVLLPGAGEPPVLGTPAEVMAVSPVYPPVVALGRLANWSPLPMTVRDARRRAADLRQQLKSQNGDALKGRGAVIDVRLPPRGRDQPHTTRSRQPSAPPGPSGATTPRRPWFRRTRTTPTTPSPHIAEVQALSVTRAHITALRHIDLTITPGETIALMGRNGAGKSTLLNSLVGVVTPSSGTIRLGEATPHRTAPQELVRKVGLVPQEPRDLLYADTVAAECAAADEDAGADPGTCRALVSELLPGVTDDTHPRDLSEGQRLALALAVVLTARPPLLLLDEPTRGLDYAAKARLVDVLRGLADEGHAIVLATHDVELAAEIAHRVVLLAEGEVIADGPTADVVVSSPSFAPQVTKILAPQQWLTVSQVRAALHTGAGS